MRRLLIVAMGLGVLGLSGEPRVRPLDWAQPVIGTELDNFFQVSEDVYRSDQPEEEDMSMLAKMGIKSLLNLREHHSDEDEAEDSGLRTFRVPIDTREIGDAQVLEALKILQDCPKPVLVHCWHGSDRTGCVIAMYRMVYQEWPKDKAIDEFKNGGFGYHEKVFPNVERYLKSVDLESIKDELQNLLRT